MFKNKKIVALALLAVMLIVPFASAFAAIPDQNYLDNWKNAAATLKAKATAYNGGVAAYKTALTTYAADGDVDAYKAAKKTYQDLLKAYEQALAAEGAAKAAKELYTLDEYVTAGFYVNNAAALADENAAKADATDVQVGLADTNKKQVAGLMFFEDLGKLAEKIKEAGDNAAAALAPLKAMEEWFETQTEAIQNMAKPMLIQMYQKWMKLATQDQITAHLGWAAVNTPKVHNIIKDLKPAADVTELQAKDAKGKTWKVIAPKSAPDALNGAVKLEVRKTEKGFKLALLDKDNKEVASKGLVYVYREVAKGTKVRDVKIGGKSAYFVFDPKTNMIDFALEIAK